MQDPNTFKMRLIRLSQLVWYKHHPLAYFLLPISLLYKSLLAIKDLLYRYGVKKQRRFKKPIVTIGNVTVGGTGKTPLTILLVERLKQQNIRVGVFSKGYGKTKSQPTPILINDLCQVKDVGDEPYLIFQKTHVPVVVCDHRITGLEYLERRNDVDVILLDDGLQDLSFHKDINICMIDSKRGFGNGFCLPAGPLREPISRINSVDLIISKGTHPTYPCQLLYADSVIVPLRAQAASFEQALHQSKRVFAICGIANPQGFFDALSQKRITFEPVVFPDHHPFKERDLIYDDDDLIIMTEKDAVKFKSFANKQMWYLQLKPKLSNDAEIAIDSLFSAFTTKNDSTDKVSTIR